MLNTLLALIIITIRLFFVALRQPRTAGELIPGLLHHLLHPSNPSYNDDCNCNFMCRQSVKLCCVFEAYVAVVEQAKHSRLTSCFCTGSIHTSYMMFLGTANGNLMYSVLWISIQPFTDVNDSRSKWILKMFAGWRSPCFRLYNQPLDIDRWAMLTSSASYCLEYAVFMNIQKVRCKIKILPLKKFQKPQCFGS